ncbi:MAG: DinB family protein [Acidobacteriota bacterium]|nr:DinB family protein [Acidobacteriota bacterium]
MEAHTIIKPYRKGPLGALMDEYERAAIELKHLVEQISEDDFVQVIDSQTKDDNCRSVQTIMSHVVSAGYSYADYTRELFSIPSTRPSKKLLSHHESLEQFDVMLGYTVESLEGRWEMSDEEIMVTVINSTWGVRYDVEQLLEHAIVHILRHRRQIEKFIWQGMITVKRGV